MKPRDIIARAWAITKKEKQLRRWGYASAMLRTMLNAKLFLFQAWLLYSYLKGNPIGFFTIERVLLDNFPTGVAVSIIIFFFVLIAVEWLFPHMAKGAIIGLAAKSQRKEEVKGGLVLAIYNFFPLFAIHEMLFISQLATAVTLSSLALRYLGEAGPMAVTIIAASWIVSNILEFFWIFSEESVVIRKVGIGRAIGGSFKLVISYLGHVLFLILLLFIILLRILINALMVILIPGVVFGLGFLLSMALPHIVGYTISTLLGLVIIGLASYLFAYLEVFRQTTWTLTYMHLSALKELDIIEEEQEEILISIPTDAKNAEKVVGKKDRKTRDGATSA